MLAGGKSDCASVLPGPCFALTPKGRVEWLTINEDLELTRHPAGVKLRHPVESANMNAISSCDRCLKRGGCICNRFSKTMSQKVGGSHSVDELGVEDPAACLFETFGFNQDALASGGQRNAPRQDDEGH